MSELKFAFRQLLKSPGFFAAPVLILAVGIGANTAIFSVINGLLLKPLPYPDSGQLVALFWESDPRHGIEQERVSGPNYLDWLAQNTVFSAMAVCPGWEGSESFNLVLSETTAKVRATYTSAALFSALGTKPLLGRALLPYWQWPMQTPTLLLRTTGNPATLAATLRHETRQLIPNLPAPFIRTMDDLVSATLAQARLQSSLLILFAAAAPPRNWHPHRTRGTETRRPPAHPGSRAKTRRRRRRPGFYRNGGSHPPYSQLAL